ncbi:transmembrane sensor [Pedobacter africanus]|uniref:Ferric-dicitrate binding protein FerR (Iron transport regulator) n=1 Tax=Pedobacter africanus TaxID=151894 RepID=A0ACC6KVG6_9SPHI|nr:FecR domain-containing protein [Pedobacter africanus]MDR6783167.1 ferric-dicitrate binding protein FerR (iron transport regulator) [Pedobacter africanus]
MEDRRTETLLNKYLEGTATPQEAAAVEEWYLKFKDVERGEITDTFIETSTDRIWQRLEKQHGLPQYKRTISIKLWAAAAAVVVVVLGGLFYYSNRNSNPAPLLAKQADVAPGANKAVLTLADGRKISLNDARNGALAQQAGISISKTADGQLVYELKAGEKELDTKGFSYNTIETPRGGQYQVSLPDGTKVWLNAASSLSYPTTFAGQRQRMVQLTGEAYFEVAKDKQHPFRVKSKSQEIEVLGTHFNVNAYADEPAVKTALLEGSVKISAGTAAVVIRPGQQASLKNGSINVEEVNTSVMADWKDGRFRFKNEPLASILRKVSRWYDVEVVYSPGFKDMPTFTGSVSRLDNVSAVLNMLEETSDVKFSIEGKTIKVQ